MKKYIPHFILFICMIAVYFITKNEIFLKVSIGCLFTPCILGVLDIIFFCRLLFKVFTVKEAEEMKLTFVQNVYGDAINRFNCRSLWVDDDGNIYRVDSLYP